MLEDERKRKRRRKGKTAKRKANNGSAGRVSFGNALGGWGRVGKGKWNEWWSGGSEAEGLDRERVEQVGRDLGHWHSSCERKSRRSLGQSSGSTRKHIRVTWRRWRSRFWKVPASGPRRSPLQVCGQLVVPWPAITGCAPRPFDEAMKRAALDYVTFRLILSIYTIMCTTCVPRCILIITVTTVTTSLFVLTHL